MRLLHLWTIENESTISRIAAAGYSSLDMYTVHSPALRMRSLSVPGKRVAVVPDGTVTCILFPSISTRMVPNRVGLEALTQVIPAQGCGSIKKCLYPGQSGSGRMPARA